MTKQELKIKVEQMRKNINQAWMDLNTKEEGVFENDKHMIETVNRWYINDVKADIRLVDHCAELIEDEELQIKIRDIKITLEQIDCFIDAKNIK